MSTQIKIFTLIVLILFFLPTTNASSASSDQDYCWISEPCQILFLDDGSVKLAFQDSQIILSEMLPYSFKKYRRELKELLSEEQKIRIKCCRPTEKNKDSPTKPSCCFLCDDEILEIILNTNPGRVIKTSK